MGEPNYWVIIPNYSRRNWKREDSVMLCRKNYSFLINEILKQNILCIVYYSYSFEIKINKCN